LAIDPQFHRAALVVSGEIFTYADLAGAEGRVASALLGGATDLQEARVAFAVAPGFAYAAALRGIWRAGGIAVPLALSHPPAEHAHVLRDAGPTIVIADAPRAARLTPLAADVGARLLTTAEVLAGPASGGADPAAERRALILYTSGTTGKPKGVVTTHAQVAAQVAALVDAWEWTAADRALLVLPLHHVHGIINVLCSALAVGAACEVLDPFDAPATWRRLASGDVTVFTAVPTVYHRLIQTWEAAPAARRQEWSTGVRGLRLMMSGSAALPVGTLTRWRELTGHTLLERYGMTEIGMGLSNPLHGERRPGFVGDPLPGVRARIVDDEGRPVADGTPGELEIQGPGVFLEYWRRPDETAQAFRDGWFRTGDVAVVEQGAHRLLGRTSVDIIKTGGYKVSALEIEDVLRRHPAVADCAVVALPDPAWGERVCAAVEWRSGQTQSSIDLVTWAREQLAPYKVPKDVHAVRELPRNAMGKVIKPEVARLIAASCVDREPRG
jgi:malonyl-CoA/methylmalonyl-CoA synthetase